MTTIDSIERKNTNQLQHHWVLPRGTKKVRNLQRSEPKLEGVVYGPTLIVSFTSASQARTLLDYCHAATYKNFTLSRHLFLCYPPANIL